MSDVEHVVVLVDGPNADNQACAWGAVNAFHDNVRLAGVIVSATAVGHGGDPLGSRRIDLSRDIHSMHTARMAGLFHRGGVDVPVFGGLDIEETHITSPIPHSAHVNHYDYDIFGDEDGEGSHHVAGDFAAALGHIAGLEGTVHLVVGGPFSEVPALMRHPDIGHKMGKLAAQAGFDLSTRAIYSKLAFNVDVDLKAALETFLHFPGEMFNVPSDITRHPDVTFTGADELIDLGVHQEIGEIFERHRARAAERHRKQEATGKLRRSYPALSIHDLQAVIALNQALGREPRDLYRFAEISPTRAVANMMRASRMQARMRISPSVTRGTVNSLGYRAVDRTAKGKPIAARFIVSGQDAAVYKQRAIELLR